MSLKMGSEWIASMFIMKNLKIEIDFEGNLLLMLTLVDIVLLKATQYLPINEMDQEHPLRRITFTPLATEMILRETLLALVPLLDTNK